MANLETLVNELPKLVPSLKLTIGDSNEIMQQIILINNVQNQLRILQQAIAQELKFTNIKNTTISTLPRLETLTSLCIPNVAVLGTDLITKRNGNLDIEISLSDLQNKINNWIEWGHFIQSIAADILSDAQLVNQINSDISYPNLPAQLNSIVTNLKINLAFNNINKLQQQIQQISKAQESLLQLQQRLNYIINTLQNSQTLLTILLGISAFCGQSGFALEWLDDEHELIISNDGKFQELREILNDCYSFQKQVVTLILQVNNLKEQAEQALIDFQQKHELNQSIVQSQFLKFRTKNIVKIRHSTLFTTLILILVVFSDWIINNKIPHLQYMVQSLNYEKVAITNFKSAQELGMEAAFLVQNPPHTLKVWEQAKTKWQKAINLLDNVPEGTSISNLAKNKLIQYRSNYNAISQRFVTEKNAIVNFELAQKLSKEADFLVKNSHHSVQVWQQAKDKWQQSIRLLEAIPGSTSISIEAKTKLSTYKHNYEAISKKIAE